MYFEEKFWLETVCDYPQKIFLEIVMKGYHRLLVRFSAKCPNCVIFGMVVANDIENIFAKFQPPELI